MRSLWAEAWEAMLVTSLLKAPVVDPTFHDRVALEVKSPTTTECGIIQITPPKPLLPFNHSFTHQPPQTVMTPAETHDNT